MFTRINRIFSVASGSIIRSTVLKSVFLAVVGLFASMSIAFGGHKLSEQFSLNIDPYSKKMIGEKVHKEIMDFFHDAEFAIESENMEALMSLYSDNYVNGPHFKSSVQDVWKRIFNEFDKMATVHNMQFITTSEGSEAMIIRCSGLLLGVPKGENNLITIDTWTNQDHILVKEKGKWKLIGTTGKERARLWFDKPMHPLF